MPGTTSSNKFLLKVQYLQFGKSQKVYATFWGVSVKIAMTCSAWPYISSKLMLSLDGNLVMMVSLAVQESVKMLIKCITSPNAILIFLFQNINFIFFYISQFFVLVIYFTLICMTIFVKYVRIYSINIFHSCILHFSKTILAQNSF